MSEGPAIAALQQRILPAGHTRNPCACSELSVTSETDLTVLLSTGNLTTSGAMFTRGALLANLFYAARQYYSHQEEEPHFDTVDLAD